jgi:hypothetical protein
LGEGSFTDAESREGFKYVAPASEYRCTFAGTSFDSWHIPLTRIMQVEKTVVIQAGEIRSYMSEPIRNWDDRFTIFYDETNNIRRLSLSEIGLNAPDNKIFVLAGIALRAGQAAPDICDLRCAVRLQGNAPELKARHIAEGDFEAMLASRHLHTYLVWLLDQGLLVHYSSLNVLYWSLIDIVESIQGRDVLVALYQRQLKNELYDVVSRNPLRFLQLLHRFSYPNIERSAILPFLTEVVAFLDQESPTDRNQMVALLRDRLRQAAVLDELVFLHDTDGGELIDNFSMHFLRGVYVFKNANHVFDQETFVEKALRTTEIRDGGRRLDYRFTDSRLEPGVQLSDVIAQLFGKYFTFLQDHRLSELLARKSKFSRLQRDNLGLLRALIDRSDAVSDGFCHTIVPLDTNYKNDAFLHDRHVPNFLYQGSAGDE